MFFTSSHDFGTNSDLGFGTGAHGKPGPHMTPGLEIELDPQRWLGEANDLTSADLCRILSPSKKALLRKDYNLVQNIAVSRGKVSTIFSLFVETAKP